MSIFLGTGSAFTLKNYHTNAIIEINNKKLLIDAGSDIRFALRDANLSYKDIDAIFITHIHSDHVGGMEYLGFARLFDSSTKRPKLYCESGLSDDLWQMLKPSMSCLEASKYTGNKHASLDTYFDVERIHKSSYFLFEGVKFELVQTVHVISRYSILNSFGLIWNHPGYGRVFYTSDTQCCPEQLKAIYDESDIIFQDCETSPFRSGVHANIEDLEKYHEEIKIKMHLMHYNDNIMDDNGNITDEWYKRIEKSGFAGFTFKGQKILE